MWSNWVYSIFESILLISMTKVAIMLRGAFQELRNIR